MNFTDKLKNKSIGYLLNLVAAVLSLIGLFIYLAYIGKGGEKNGLIIPLIVAGIAVVVVLFFYEGKFSDILAVLPGVLFITAMGLSINSGIGNITDDITGIDCFGIASIAKYNYQMAWIFTIGAVLSVVAAFLPRVKKAR